MHGHISKFLVITIPPSPQLAYMFVFAPSYLSLAVHRTKNSKKELSLRLIVSTLCFWWKLEIIFHTSRLIKHRSREFACCPNVKVRAKKKRKKSKEKQRNDRGISWNRLERSRTRFLCSLVGCFYPGSVCIHLQYWGRWAREGICWKVLAKQQNRHKILRKRRSTADM